MKNEKSTEMLHSANINKWRFFDLPRKWGECANMPLRVLEEGECFFAFEIGGCY